MSQDKVAAWAMVGSIVSDGGQIVAAKQMVRPEQNINHGSRSVAGRCSVSGRSATVSRSESNRSAHGGGWWGRDLALYQPNHVNLPVYLLLIMCCAQVLVVA